MHFLYIFTEYLSKPVTQKQVIYICCGWVHMVGSRWAPFAQIHAGSLLHDWSV